MSMVIMYTIVSFQQGSSSDYHDSPVLKVASSVYTTNRKKRIIVIVSTCRNAVIIAVYISLHIIIARKYCDRAIILYSHLQSYSITIDSRVRRRQSTFTPILNT